MTLRATQRWLGHRSLTNTAAPAGPGDLSTISGGSERYRLGSVDQTLDRVALSPPLDRTFCPLLDTISFAEPVRGAHPPTGRARTKAPAVRWGFRFVIFPAHAGWRRLLEKRGHSEHAARQSCSLDHRHVTSAASLMSGRNGHGPAAALVRMPGARIPFAIDGHVARIFIHQRLTMIALKPTMIATRIALSRRNVNYQKFTE